MSNNEFIRRRIQKKILPEYFKAVCDREKTFELRKDEDNIQVGDILVLKEWIPDTGYTSKRITREVTYVLRNCPQYGLMDGYCIIGMQPIGWKKEWYEAQRIKMSFATLD